MAVAQIVDYVKTGRIRNMDHGFSKEFDKTCKINIVNHGPLKLELFEIEYAHNEDYKIEEELKIK